MKDDEFVIFDFSYIDEHLSMIQNKTIEITKLSIFNGFINKIFIMKRMDDNTFKYYHFKFNNIEVEIDYDELIKDIMVFYQTSYGKITLIYRIFTNSINKHTNGKFRELWGDILFVDPYKLKMESKNINAETLSNIVISLNLNEDEVKIFGSIEEYIFKDNNNNIILGLDLV
jgi:hypothetical protein